MEAPIAPVEALCMTTTAGEAPAATALRRELLLRRLAGGDDGGASCCGSLALAGRLFCRCCLGWLWRGGYTGGCCWNCCSCRSALELRRLLRPDAGCKLWSAGCGLRLALPALPRRSRLGQRMTDEWGSCCCCGW
jgi:hypothetical protein